MKKECKYNQLISPFMDSELSKKKMEKVRSHLETCKECQNELSQLNAAESLLTELPELEPSKDFDRSFWRNISELEEKKRAWSFSNLFTYRWQPYLATALTIMLVAGFVIFYQKPSVPGTDDIIISENLELFQDYEMINNLDLLENWEAIMTLKETS